MGMISTNKVFCLMLAGVVFTTIASCGNSTNFRAGNNEAAADQLKKNGDATAVKPDAAAEPVEDTRTGNPDPQGPKTPEMRVIEREFTAGTIASDSVTYKLNRSKVETTIAMTNSYGDPAPQAGSVERTLSRSDVQSNVTMSSVYSTHTPSDDQVNREPVPESFTQGSAGTTMSQTFSQSTAKSGPIDILLVVDNSGSMNEEQQNLATKLNPLLASLSNADWQISIVTTDPRVGFQHALIRKRDSNASATFASTINGVGLSGSGNERGFLMAVIGLKGSFTVPGATAGSTMTIAEGGACASTASSWLRPGAPVVTLIVSDEDNCSADGAGCPSNHPWRTDDYLFNFLSSIRTPGVDTRVYGLHHRPGTSCSSAYNVGTQYERIVTRTSGLSGSICDADYTTTLNRISQDAATILKDQFSLTSAPDVGSARVYVNGVLTPTGWNVVNKTLSFTTPPPAGASIRVDYVVGSAPILTELPLSHPAAPETIVIKENGLVVAPSRYTYSAATNKVAFRAADRATIQVDYRKSTPALKRTFDLGLGTQPIDLVVKVNGQAAGSYTVDAATGRITFATPPPDAAVISASFRKLESKTLTYPFAVPANVHHKNWVATINGTSTTIPVTYSNGTVTFNVADHVDNRVVRVSYRSRLLNQEVHIPLPHTPMAGTLNVIAGGNNCLPNQYSMGNGELIVSCDPGANDRISASYMYIDQSLIGKVVVGPVLQYDLPIPANVDARDLKAIVDPSGEEIPVTWAAGKVHVAAADHVEGRVIKVSYMGRAMGEEAHIPLAQLPIPGTVLVTAGTSPCAASDFVVNPGELVVSCDPGASDQIAATFHYVSQVTKNITISDVTVPDGAVWQVSVDGVLARPGTDFSRKGNNITILRDIAPTSKIKVTINVLGE